MYFLKSVWGLPAWHSRLSKIYPVLHTHLPFLHTPKCSLLWHCSSCVQYPPSGTLTNCIIRITISIFVLRLRSISTLFIVFSIIGIHIQNIVQLHQWSNWISKIILIVLVICYKLEHPPVSALFKSPNIFNWKWSHHFLSLS